MKREFLLGLQVAGSPLPKEIVDAIMAENGKDIEAVKAHYADYDGLKEQLDQQVDTHRREMSDLIFRIFQRLFHSLRYLMSYSLMYHI